MSGSSRAQEVIAKLASLPPGDRERITRLVHLCSKASVPVQAYVTTMLRAPPEPASLEEVRDRADAVIAYLAEKN